MKWILILILPLVSSLSTYRCMAQTGYDSTAKYRNLDLISLQGVDKLTGTSEEYPFLELRWDQGALVEILEHKRAFSYEKVPVVQNDGYYVISRDVPCRDMYLCVEKKILFASEDRMIQILSERKEGKKRWKVNVFSEMRSDSLIVVSFHRNGPKAKRLPFSYDSFPRRFQKRIDFIYRIYLRKSDTGGFVEHRTFYPSAPLGKRLGPRICFEWINDWGMYWPAPMSEWIRIDCPE